MTIGGRWLRSLATGALATSLVALPAFGQPEPSPPQAIGEECEADAETIQFKIGSAKLSKEAKAKLDDLADEMRENDQQLAKVEGHTDSTGSPAVNQRLSAERAKAVEQYLSRKGIDTQRVEYFGRGEVEEAAGPDPEARVASVTACRRLSGEEAAQAAAAAEPQAAEPTPEPEPTPAPEVTAEPAPPPPAPTEVEMPPPPEPMGEVARAAEEAEALPSRIGIGIAAGGGVMGFNDTRSSDIADTGGTWEVRLTLGTKFPVGLDLAYVGSAQSLNVGGLDTDAIMLGNGGEATLRLQWPTGIARPFLFGGIGWMYYSVERSSVLGTTLFEHDEVGTVPIGGGVAVHVARNVNFELRFTERLAFDDDLFRTQVEDTADGDLDSWNVTAQLGFMF
jgi:outer membrane protein OmpA-like peptidoglycan-associated protein